jgi:hypothetical protein
MTKLSWKEKTEERRDCFFAKVEKVNKPARLPSFLLSSVSCSTSSVSCHVLSLKRRSYGLVPRSLRRRSLPQTYAPFRRASCSFAHPLLTRPVLSPCRSTLRPFPPRLLAFLQQLETDDLPSFSSEPVCQLPPRTTFPLPHSSFSRVNSSTPTASAELQL